MLYRQIFITVYHCICKNRYSPLFFYVTVALHDQFFQIIVIFYVLLQQIHHNHILCQLLYRLVVINIIVGVITVSFHCLSPQFVSCCLFVFNHGLFLLLISERNMSNWLTCFTISWPLE